VRPENLLYAKTHEWTRIEEAGGAKTAVVGLTDFALELLTDLVYINLPEVGRVVDAEEPMGEVESVKAVSDIFSPVSGEIVEVNEAVVDNLDMLSDDPFGDGWLVKVKITDDAGLANLMDAAAYEKQCSEECS
jgi:glycine cleavage system H protein